MDTKEGIQRLLPVAEEFMKSIFGLEPGSYRLTEQSRLTDFTVDGVSTEELICKVIDTYHLGLVPNNLLLLFRELAHRKRLEEARQHFPPTWTIYDHPDDYPDKFAVRVWYGEVGETECTTHDCLEDARESIIARGGSGFFSPSPGDIPSIVETWI